MEQFGIVGLPNAGKSSLFNALTGGSAVVAPHPFSTTETNIGVATVPDPRVDALAVMLERASNEILDALTGFSQQWQRFSDHVDKLGKQLGTVQGTYDELATTRRRQLEKQLDEIEAIRTRQALPGPDDHDEPETPVLREVSAL